MRDRKRASASASLDAVDAAGANRLSTGTIVKGKRVRFDDRHAPRTDNSVAHISDGWTSAMPSPSAMHCASNAYASLVCGRKVCCNSRCSWAATAGIWTRAWRHRRRSGWGVTDEVAFHERAMATIVDHGIGLPIFAAHWLKTWSAVRGEVAAGLPASARTTMLAAVNRLLAVHFKQRHALRTAHQALAFVGKEG
jgi:hypothetical protein